MRLFHEWRDALWTPDPPDRHRLVRVLLGAARVAERLILELYTGQLNLYAMSLVYTTLLSIVPVLAVSFSVLKAFGVHNQLEPALRAFLQPLGPGADQLTLQIMDFVDNIQVGVLGALGLGFLIYTTISLMQKVEEAFNFIWKSRGGRTLSRRFSDYLSVTLVGPVLVFTAFGITGSAMDSELARWLVAHEPARTLISLGSRLVPLALVVTAFTFIYTLIPNTRVKLKAAFTGALLAGLLWETAGMVFSSFISESTSYTAIYSSFAIGILTIIWVYVAWLILLVGCRLAFYRQYPERLWLSDMETGASPREAEALALRTMLHAGRRFRHGERPVRVHELVRATGSALVAVERTVANLESSRLLTPVESSEAAYMPGRSLDRITVTDIVRAARGKPNLVRSDLDALVETLIQGFESAYDKQMGQQTLDDLLSRLEASSAHSLRASA